jgi:hypothetical protein
VRAVRNVLAKIARTGSSAAIERHIVSVRTLLDLLPAPKEGQQRQPGDG